AMEGHRFFDLVRWNIAEQVLNAYIQYSCCVAQNKRTYLSGAKFDPQDRYYPIPQRQIDLSGGTLKQNR
ncbi:MAG: RagB/SusD family nutrient uptake outer membrane protein, partial [Chitinophagaceae bacterium]